MCGSEWVRETAGRIVRVHGDKVLKNLSGDHDSVATAVEALIGHADDENGTAFDSGSLSEATYGALLDELQERVREAWEEGHPDAEFKED